MVNLEKGGNILLDSLGYTDNTVFVGLNWSTKSTDTINVDASAFLIAENGSVRSYKDFIFYNQPFDTDKCISLESDPINEDMIKAFNISLKLIPNDVKKILFVLTIDDAEKNNQDFRMVNNISLHICDNNLINQSLARFDIEAENQEASLMIGELYLHDDSWKFKAIGQGFKEGLGAIAEKYKVDLGALYKNINDDDIVDALKKRRRAPNEVLSEHTSRLLRGIKESLPAIHGAVGQKLNESNTRMILDRIFVDIFGYKISEVKAEQEIQGRRADYILSPNNKDVLVIEVKKAGMALREKQIFQATSYGAYSGIKWALLTNLVQWNVYHISTEDKVEGHCVFSVDLSEGVTRQDAEFLVLISRYGLGRESLLEKLWLETNALSESSIISAMLTGDVITKIRLTIKRDKGISITNEQVQLSLEKILRLD